MTKQILILSGLACLSCSKGDKVPSSLAPPPLPKLSFAKDAGELDPDREALHRVAPAETLGSRLKSNPARLTLEKGKWTLAGKPFDPTEAKAKEQLRQASGPQGILFKPEPDSYLSEWVELLELIADEGIPFAMSHPLEDYAYPLLLKDEAQYQAWLDEPKPGKIRVIQRSDGFELTTNMGKLPGPDRNGPSIPTRGGNLDIATLRRGVQALKGRFTEAKDICLVPSFGTEALPMVQALSGLYVGKDEPAFETLCLVYPRRAAK